MENLVYAPVLLFVYNRPAHTRRLVESLLQNPESAESRLFIYSDAPRDEAARPAVDEVRRYVRSLKGFKQVNRRGTRGELGTGAQRHRRCDHPPARL